MAGKGNSSAALNKKGHVPHKHDPLFLISVRVEQVVAFLLPHRPGRADFPHPVPLNPVSLKENCDRFWVSAKAAIG